VLLDPFFVGRGALYASEFRSQHVKWSKAEFLLNMNCGNRENVVQPEIREGRSTSCSAPSPSNSLQIASVRTRRSYYSASRRGASAESGLPQYKLLHSPDSIDRI
jgi:hypothetical protein